ncbi:NRDE protein-domain-containing protein [Coniochaeta sp. 2T2.1]|nr:NRDE protein-domain-containing protein [Coniochaeta sp. 2T2.1]
MCIVLLTTAHPSYALIVLDNRDEFILRPTSRPHWWTSATQEVLSARDLQRAEHGTWLGVTKDGNLAVLTNFRETNVHDASHPVHGTRSRGGMVTAWLGADPREKVSEFVTRMLDGGVSNVGGFSLICGKLRQKRHGDSGAHRSLEPLAIISNRSEGLEGVPWIGEERGAVYGLSNTCYGDPEPWPKVELGKELLTKVVRKAAEEKLDEEHLIDELLGILDTDTLPRQQGMAFEDCINTLKHSIFIPPIGDEHHCEAMERARAKGKLEQFDEATEELRGEERPDETSMGFETGMYGTQRQTVILVDWEGNVTFRERALWNKHGHPLKRGEGDMTFKFRIEGWEDGKGSML